MLIWIENMYNFVSVLWLNNIWIQYREVYEECNFTIVGLFWLMIWIILFVAIDIDGQRRGRARQRRANTNKDDCSDLRQYFFMMLDNQKYSSHDNWPSSGTMHNYYVITRWASGLTNDCAIDNVIKLSSKFLPIKIGSAQRQSKQYFN